MPIIVPVEENPEDLTDPNDDNADNGDGGLGRLSEGLAQLGGGGSNGQALADAPDEKRRRELAAAIAAVKLGDEHQRNIDDAAVKKAYVGYSDQAAERLHGADGLLKQSGADAHAAFPGMVAALADAHDQALAPLDPVQHGVIAPILAERLRSDVDQAADHVRQQGVAEQDEQSGKLKQAAARDAVNHADDPDLFDHHMATGENAIRQQAKINNLSGTALAKQIADYRSGVRARAIGGLTGLEPVRTADWPPRIDGTMTGSDQSTVYATLRPTMGPAPRNTDTDTTGGSNFGYAAAVTGNGAIAPRIMNASFDASDGSLNRSEIDLASDDVTMPGAQPASTEIPSLADGVDSGSALSGTPSENGGNDSTTNPFVAAGDGGAPMDIHMDDKPSPALWHWLGKPARADQYVINTPPDFISRFRRAVPEFARREEAVFAASKSTEPPLEHALLVYQSVNDPHVYTTRVVAAKDDRGIIFHDFVTGHELSFGRLPELNGFRLIIAEHTHPLPWYSPFRHTTAAQGPSNLDVAMSKLNPNVYFVINAVHTNDFMDGSNDESYYYGRGVQPR